MKCKQRQYAHKREPLNFGTEGYECPTTATVYQLSEFIHLFSVRHFPGHGHGGSRSQECRTWGRSTPWSGRQSIAEHHALIYSVICRRTLSQLVHLHAWMKPTQRHIRIPHITWAQVQAGRPDRDRQFVSGIVPGQSESSPIQTAVNTLNIILNADYRVTHVNVSIHTGWHKRNINAYKCQHFKQYFL